LVSPVVDVVQVEDQLGHTSIIQEQGPAGQRTRSTLFLFLVPSFYAWLAAAVLQMFPSEGLSERIDPGTQIPRRNTTWSSWYAPKRQIKS
jgi:hypothetical protein